MEIAIGEDDEAAILRLRVFSCLLFADQRIFIFRLGFKNDERKATVIEQQEVDETFAGFFEISPKGIESALGNVDVQFKLDIGGLLPSGKNRQPAVSSSLLILMRAVASFIDAMSLHSKRDCP